VIIDSKEFYLLCAQAVMDRHAVVLVDREEFNQRMHSEDEFLRKKQQVPTVYGPFANAGYQNFIAADDACPYLGHEIVTLFEVVG
jgi:hypothetical protein